MNERKVISINPDLFQTSSNRTRKKQQNLSNKELKVRAPTDKTHNSTRRRIMNQIRAQQQLNYEKTFTENEKRIAGGKISVPDASYESSDLDIFNQGFDESVEYLNSISEKMEKDKVKHNQTLKSHGGSLRNSPLVLNHLFSENVNNQMPEAFQDMSNAVKSNESPSTNPMRLNGGSMPQYGCLKGGSLPTYRSLQTRRNYSSPSMVSSLPQRSERSERSERITNVSENRPNLSSSNFYPSPQMFGGQSSVLSEMEKIRREKKEKTTEMLKIKDKLKQMNTNKDNQIRYLKQKKTLRRTYYVGKSKVIPKVSVLISNKTIRNNISNKTQMLKQIPMQEIKRELIKKGFIRVGSIAPNDVLRKMYESVSLICGEIQNHNPDNLLYNFFNGEK
jgi:hypothetical protein